MHDVDLREVLTRAVLDLPTAPPEPARTLRRAKFRAARTVVGAVVALVAVAAAIPGLLALSDRAAERPAGRVTTEFTISDGGSPVTVAAAEDGVWVVKETQRENDVGWRGELLKVDTDGRVETSIPVGTDAAGVTFRMQVGYGAVWVLSHSRERLVRVDQVTGETEEISVPGINPSLDVGAGGIWLATTIGELVRVDPTTRRAEDSITVGGRPIAVAAARGTVWVADEFDGTVRRIDPATGEVTAEIVTGADLGPDMVADHRGAWTVVCRPLDGSSDPRAAVHGCRIELLFIDVRTDAVGWSIPLLEGEKYPQRLDTGAHWTAVEAVDRHGVWVTMSDALCRLTSYDPCRGDLILRISHAGEVIGHADLGLWIRDLVADDGTLWISDVRQARVIGWTLED